MSDDSPGTDAKGAQSDLLVLNPGDNIAILKRPAVEGSLQRVGAGEVTLEKSLAMGHKVAALHIAKGENILKYGCPIGYATCDIAPGEHVHLHNLASRYTEIKDWEAEE